MLDRDRHSQGADLRHRTIGSVREIRGDQRLPARRRPDRFAPGELGRRGSAAAAGRPPGTWHLRPRAARNWRRGVSDMRCTRRQLLVAAAASPVTLALGRAARAADALAAPVMEPSSTNPADLSIVELL